MASWPQVRIGDVLVRARRPVDVDPTATYDEVGIRSHGKGFFEKAPTDGAALGSKRIFEIHEGDLVLNIVFAWEGAVALAGAEQDGKVASHRFPTYIGREDHADARYLRYFLISEDGRDLLGRISPGSAGRNKTLNLTAFEDSAIPLPALSEQRRTADKLDALSDHARKVALLREKHTRLVLSVTASTFAALSEDVPETPLGAVLEQSRDEVAVEPDGIYRPAGIYSFGRGLFARPPITGMDTKYRKFNRLRAGQFVYSKVGSWEGAVAVVTSEFDGLVVSPEYPVFNVDDDQIDLDYLSWICRWAGLRDLLAPRGSMVRRKRVHPAQLAEVAIPLPPLDEQRRLGRLGARLADLERRGQEMDRLLEALPPAAIGAALRGDL